MLVNSILKQTEIRAMPEAMVRLVAQNVAVHDEEMLLSQRGTRMTLIGRIFTDIFNPWVSVSSVQSVFYRIPRIIDDDKKPQMRAAGCRNRYA